MSQTRLGSGAPVAGTERPSSETRGDTGPVPEWEADPRPLSCQRNSDLYALLPSLLSVACSHPPKSASLTQEDGVPRSRGTDTFVWLDTS